MQQEQRPVVAADSFAPMDQLWEPEIELTDGTTAPVNPTADSFYVVVDDIDAGIVGLDPAPWPHLDHAGRLSFPDVDEEWEARVATDANLDEFQSAVNAARTRADQIAPERRLRVGDVFHVPGPEWPDDLASAKPIDVSRPARRAAKIAHYGAIAPRVTPAEAERLELAKPPEPDAPRQSFPLSPPPQSI